MSTCSASVTAVFIFDDAEQTELAFQRSVQGAASEYRVNNSVSTKSSTFCSHTKSACALNVQNGKPVIKI